MNQPMPRPDRHPLRGQPAPVPPVLPAQRRTNHVLHLLLTVFTFGFWIFVWPCVAAWNYYQGQQEQEQYQRDLALYHQVRNDWERANR